MTQRHWCTMILLTFMRIGKRLSEWLLCFLQQKQHVCSCWVFHNSFINWARINLLFTKYLALFLSPKRCYPAMLLIFFIMSYRCYVCKHKSRFLNCLQVLLSLAHKSRQLTQLTLNLSCSSTHQTVSMRKLLNPLWLIFLKYCLYVFTSADMFRYV